MNTAIVQSISRIGQSEKIAVQVSFSDGSNKEYQFDLPLNKTEAQALIKADIDRLNSIDGQVAELQILVGKIIK